MKKNWAALFAGLIFGIGLSLSGMTDPANILGFLDISGEWKPNLLFVFAGAVGVTLIAFRFVLKRQTPFLADRFPVITRTIDRSLFIGAVIFGVGWGIAGYCPGPAIASIGSFNKELLVFLPAMFAGTLLHKSLQLRQTSKGTAVSTNQPKDCG